MHKSESMVSLCYRSLAGFIVDNNLQALHAFLENKQILIDDRDEVCSNILSISSHCIYFDIFIVLIRNQHRILIILNVDWFLIKNDY